jgi:hypothetical protein
MIMNTINNQEPKTTNPSYLSCTKILKFYCDEVETMVGLQPYS